MLACLLFKIFAGQADGYFFEKIVKYIVAAMGLGNQPAVNIHIAMRITEDLEAVKKLPALLTLLQAWIRRLLFVQQTHNAGLLWPDKVFQQPGIENSRRDKHHHRPNP